MEEMFRMMQMVRVYSNLPLRVSGVAPLIRHYRSSWNRIEETLELLGVIRDVIDFGTETIVGAVRVYLPVDGLGSW